MQEKRVHQRKPLQGEVICYIDGQRFDALAKDISLGGMFVKTPNSKAINNGALVGLVFPGGSHSSTTFIFGKVARHQETPDEGLGLCWEKAVCAGSPDALAKFLLVLFEIRNPKIVSESTNRGPRSVYKFEDNPSAPATTASPDMRFSAVNRNLNKSASEGALTGFIKREDTSFDCYIKGFLMEGQRKFPVLITKLGITSAMVRTVVEHDQWWSRVELHFEIPTREGFAPILARGEIKLIDPNDLQNLPVAFGFVDEGESPGIYSRYLKWLQFHQLAKSPDQTTKNSN
jgi:hypothetical protein